MHIFIYPMNEVVQNRSYMKPFFQEHYIHTRDTRDTGFKVQTEGIATIQ